MIIISFFRYHPPDHSGELRLPGRPPHRHRLAHTQRRRPGRPLHRRGWRRRRGRHGRPALGAQVPQGHRCQAHRGAERLDVAKGCHPQVGGHLDGEGRHGRYCRVLWSRSEIHNSSKILVLLLPGKKKTRNYCM